MALEHSYTLGTLVISECSRCTSRLVFGIFWGISFSEACMYIAFISVAIAVKYTICITFSLLQ